MSELIPRRVAESQAIVAELMMPNMANLMGNVFGGVVLSLVDRVAAVAAIRHARRYCVTVSLDRVDFKEPIYVGELLTARASVNYVGRTSMEVGVRVDAENLLSGETRHTNTCYATFVALDERGKPVVIPAVIPETFDEKRRYAAAEDRHRERAQERKHLD